LYPAYDPNKLSIQRIPWVIYEAIMVSDLRECLARRASHYGINVLARSGFKKFLSHLALSKVTVDSPCRGEIGGVSSTSVGVNIGADGDQTASLAEAFGHASSSAEKIGDPECRLALHVTCLR
jgi:hypothetical protein